MAKTIKTKYGTVINVDGLTPDQIAKVKSIAEDKGAYGAKGAALADSLRKRNAAGKKNTGAGNNNAGAGQDLTAGKSVNAETGQINPEILDNMPGTSTLQGLSQEARDANYAYITKDYATDKSREMEETRQMLAEQGIPLDFTPGSKYAKAMESIDRKYQGLYDQAKQQSILTGDNSLSTLTGAQTNLQDSFIRGVTGVATVNSGVNAVKTEEELMKKKIEEDARLARMRAAGSGGSGGGSNDPVIGGAAPGFNV